MIFARNLDSGWSGRTEAKFNPMDRSRAVLARSHTRISNQRNEGGVMSSGTSDEIKGRVEEAVGVLTDDQRLKDEGKLDQATGKVKKAVERVIDKAKG